ncbi:NAD-dependent epimerase/dehydratase family protein [Thermophilibacter sp.]
MRLLFAGDFDIVGRAIATRMYREGNQIAWLTSDSTPALWGDKVRGRVFRDELTAEFCDQVLDGDAPDCIVFMTASWRELTTRPARRGTLLRDLGTVLRSAAKAGVRTVCLLSSEFLRDSGLLTPPLEELRASERIVTEFCHENGMKPLVLRMGLAFDGEPAPPEATLALQIMDKMAAGGRATCPLAPGASFDMICSSDVADAFVRLVNLGVEGLHTVLTGTATTASELCETLARVVGVEGGVDYGTLGYGCDESCSERLRLLSGWTPLHLFSSSGEDCLRRARELALPASDPSARTGLRALLRGHPLVWETVQNLTLFVVALALAHFAKDWSDLRYVDVRLLYVIIVAVCFGMRQGLIATALACLGYGSSLLLSGVDLSYLAYSVSTWIPFIIYGVAGAFGGYWSDKKNDEYDNLVREFTEQTQRYELLKDLYREVVALKNRFQKQIVVSKDSLNRAYELAAALDSNNPRALFAQAARVMEQAMDTNGAAIYVISDERGRWARLAVCSTAWSGTLASSLDLELLPELAGRIATNEVFVNRALDQLYPSIAMPVRHDGRPVALVAVYGLPMESFTTKFENRFKTLVRMIQDGIVRAIEYQQANYDKLYLPRTRVMRPEAFASELETLRAAQDEYAISSCVASLVCADGNAAPDAVSKLAEPLLRVTDLMGVGGDGLVHAVFLHVAEDQRARLERRLTEGGLVVRWEEDPAWTP